MGNYSCEARNIIGTARSTETDIILVEIPQLPEIECDKSAALPNRVVCHGNFGIIKRERLPTGFRVELAALDGALLIYSSETYVPFTGNSQEPTHSKLKFPLGDLITVRNLNATTDYRVRFKSYNEAGESNWSEPQQFATGEPTAPESISDIHWHCDEAKCSFKWTPGDDNGV